MPAEGGNVYYLAKFAGIFGLDVQDMGAQQTGAGMAEAHCGAEPEEGQLGSGGGLVACPGFARAATAVIGGLVSGRIGGGLVGITHIDGLLQAVVGSGRRGLGGALGFGRCDRGGTGGHERVARLMAGEAFAVAAQAGLGRDHHHRLVAHRGADALLGRRRDEGGCGFAQQDRHQGDRDQQQDHQGQQALVAQVAVKVDQELGRLDLRRAPRGRLSVRSPGRSRRPGTACTGGTATHRPSHLSALGTLGG